MKTPNVEALNSLRKAPVVDPVIAGEAGNTGNADIASNASKGNIASQGGNVGTASNTAKFTIRMEEGLLGRLRAAYLHDLTTGFSGSLSAWAAQQLEQAVENAEIEHNSGNPFIPIQTGSIPTGRMP